jgi:AcrR family transcriptional regulator
MQHEVLRHAIREFPQARSHATYRALLEAARRTFAHKGFDAAQTPDIAARAGVSTGTFYRYFTDKRQAFVEMIAAHLAAAHADVMDQLKPERFVGRRRDLDRRRAIEVALDVLFAHVGRFPDLEGVFLEMSLRDPEVARLRAEWEALGCEELAALIQVVVPRHVVPDARAAAYVIHHAVLEIAFSRVVRRGAELFPIEDEPLKAALREMLLRFLFPEEPLQSGIEQDAPRQAAPTPGLDALQANWAAAATARSAGAPESSAGHARSRGARKRRR